MIKKTIILFLMLGTVSNSCLAVDPTFIPIDKAIQQGETIFVGEINNISVTNRIIGKTSARAKIKIKKCLHGKNCKEGKILDINYLAESSKDTLLSVNLQISGQVIFILNNKVNSSTYNFDSSINSKIDHAFLCNAFPYSIIDEYSKFKCQNSVTGKTSKLLTFEMIKSMLSMPKK